MANTRSADKQARVSKRRRVINISIRTSVKSAETRIRSLAKAGKKDEALKLLPSLQSELDRAAKKGVLSKNTASRHKARVAKLLK